MKEAVKRVDKIDPKKERFYGALGLFNTNVVAWLLSNPDKIDELTDMLNGFSCMEVDNRCRDLGPDYQWSERDRACIRRPSEFADAG